MDEKRRLMFHEETIAFCCFVWKNAKLEITTGRKWLLVPHFADVWTLLSKDEQSNSPWLTMPKGAANWLRWNFLNKIHFGWLPWIPSTTNSGLHPLEKLEFSEVADKLENWYSERFNFRGKTKPTWAQKNVNLKPLDSINKWLAGKIPTTWFFSLMKMYLTYEQKNKGDFSSLPNVSIPPGVVKMAIATPMCVLVYHDPLLIHLLGVGDRHRSFHDLHPRKLTWNLKTKPWKRRFLLKTIMFRFHVKFQGCSVLFLEEFVSCPGSHVWRLFFHQATGAQRRWKFVMM